MRRRTASLGVACLASLALGGCGNGAQLPRADLPVGVLPVSLGACSETGHIDGPNPFEFVSKPGAWLRVESISSSVPVDDHGTFSGRFVIVGGDSSVVDRLGSSPVDRVDGHGSIAKAAQEALALGATVYLHAGFADNPREVVYAVALKDRAFAFLGECEHRMLTTPFVTKFGAGAPDIVRDIVGKPSDDVAATLGIVANASASPPPGQVILNEEFTPKEHLSGLKLGLFHLNLVPKSWAGDYTICTHIPKGWSDCVSLASAESASIPVNLYFDPAKPEVELWLLNGHASVSSPLALLGVADLAYLATQADIGLSAAAGVQLDVDLSDATSPGEIVQHSSEASKAIKALRLVEA